MRKWTGFILIVFGLSGFNAAAKGRDLSYACVPSYMILKNVKNRDLCDARKVNFEESVQVDARGCAPKNPAPVPPGEDYWKSAMPQTRVTTRGGGKIKLRSCEFSEVITVLVGS